ncbi:hypothetical protein ABBQ32_010773 [Trebouxia sp. C0010 RCD-2024]
MVRGRCCQSKSDSVDVDNLFQLITSDWVFDFESEKRGETILNVWKAGLKFQVQVTKLQIPWTVAMRKRLGYEAVMKDNDACFASLQDSNELCGLLDRLLDAIEVHNCNPRRKPFIPPSQLLCYS